MEEDRPQKELFEFKTPRRRYSGFAGIFRKAGIDGSVFAITLKIDKLVFISIAIIMMMVIVYALGVERGRSVKPKLSLEPMPHAASSKALLEIKPQPVSAATVTAVKDVVLKPYTIAVASLTRKETALEEASRMKVNGLEAFVMNSQPYYVVCVGAFADKTSSVSQKELARVKRFCKDAYFKQR
ncbi:MAG: SPOR domain-containing protein [Candidatus Omnitrophica bacterium]|nr:SPOR domain-containing protein [Candidatus Omnitrophota bacterium]